MRKRPVLISAAVALAFFSILILVLCGPLISAALRSDERFLVSPVDARVRYERGAEANAAIIAAALPQSIATIENVHREKFAKPIVVYVCATLKTFEDFTGVPTAGGAVMNQRLFISPKPANTPERLPRVLTHELSHLHFEQRLGGPAWNLGIPSWFQEGLAVFASNGGGAENVSPAEAIRAILDDRHFIPRTSGNVLRRLLGKANDDLPQHLFYRQSGLFVEYLQARNPEAFRTLIDALLNGSNFADAFRSAYAQEIPTLWNDFVAQLRRR